MDGHQRGGDADEPRHRNDGADAARELRDGCASVCELCEGGRDEGAAGGGIRDGGRGNGQMHWVGDDQRSVQSVRVYGWDGDSAGLEPISRGGVEDGGEGGADQRPFQRAGDSGLADELDRRLRLGVCLEDDERLCEPVLSGMLSDGEIRGEGAIHVDALGGTNGAADGGGRSNTVPFAVKQSGVHQRNVQ